MSLNRLEIRNFQSLKKVDLDLGLFTVIVGPSSSGKSALIRACRALASNLRGSAVITKGQKSLAITGRTDTHTITLERSESTGSYRLTDQAGTELVFTKLGGGVPEQITKALRIAPVVAAGSSVNFASQFDQPYLLDETGAHIAWALGELTNVTTIFEAVRSANKIRLNAASTLKTRTKDLGVLQARLTQFQGLSDRLAALEVAETRSHEAGIRLHAIERLDKSLRTLQLAELTLAKAQVLPEVPDAAPLDDAMNRYLDLQAKLRGLAAQDQRVNYAEIDVIARSAVLSDYEAQLADLLIIAKVCPTCGQSTV